MKLVGIDGNHYRYDVAYMLVYEEWTLSQIEWYRGFYSSQIHNIVFEAFFFV